MSDSENKPDAVMVILSYLGLLALIPFFIKKDDAEIQWHAKQGLIFGVALFVLMIALGIAASIVSILGLLSMVVWLGWLVVTILCILKGLKGERFEIPVISGFISKVPSAA